MKKELRMLFKVLPHAVVVMSGMMIVFFLIDRVNTPMGFMTNEFHKWLSMMLALISLGYAVLTIAWQRRQERIAEQRRRQEMKNRRPAPRPAQARPSQARPAARPAQARPVQARPVQTRHAPAGRTTVR